MIPATMVAEILHVPLGEAMSFAKTGQFFGSGERLQRESPTNGRILVLDDTTYQGKSLLAVREAVFNSPHCTQYECLFGAVYCHPLWPETTTLFAREIDSPRYFEWNLMQHADMANWMLDIDGVLCFNGTVFDDDSEQYRQSLVNAVPFHLPGRKVHSLCSMRLERWRTETEAWLAQYGVQYGNLHLSQHTTAGERRRYGMYGEIKGKLYRNSPCTLFVESSRDQAPIIARVSGKPVICLDTQAVFQGR
jgi:uncharacterized HAD superfamily protein